MYMYFGVGFVAHNYNFDVHVHMCQAFIWPKNFEEETGGKLD